MGSGSTYQRYFGLKGSHKAGSLLSEDFLTYSFKVTPCNRKYPHDWASCLCGHKGERATRRDLRTHSYLPIACEYAKQKLECPRGDACPQSHNLFEYWLHPKRYKTELCLFRANCDRPVCFFAHSTEELRTLDDGLPPAELCWSAGAAISSKHSSQAKVVRAKQQQHHHQHQQQQQQQHAVNLQQQGVAAMPQQQMLSVSVSAALTAVVQQQQQAAYSQSAVLPVAQQHQGLHIPASVELQPAGVQQQQPLYMHMTGSSSYAVLGGNPGAGGGSQPMVLLQQLQLPEYHHQQQQQQLVMVTQSSQPAVISSEAPTVPAAAGLSVSPHEPLLPAGLSLPASPNLQPAAASAEWQLQQQQHMLLAGAGVQQGGLFLQQTADSGVPSWGSHMVNMSPVGHMCAVLPFQSALPAVTGTLLAPGGLMGPVSMPQAAAHMPCSRAGDACGSEISSVVAVAPPSNSSSASSGLNMVAMLASSTAGLQQHQLQPVMADVQLQGLGLTSAGPSNMSSLMAAFQHMGVAVTQA